MAELASDLESSDPLPAMESLPGLRVVLVPEEGAADPLAPPDIKRDQWEQLGLEELVDIRQSLSDYRGRLAVEIMRLQEFHDEALRRQIEVHGWIRDRK